VGNGKPADEGRAGTISPTHPHNEPSLDDIDGHEETEQKRKNKIYKKGNEEIADKEVNKRGEDQTREGHGSSWIGSEKMLNTGMVSQLFYVKFAWPAQRKS
jgi:hypothetical protein